MRPLPVLLLALAPLFSGGADAGFTAAPATPPAAAENQNAGATVLEARATSLEADVRVAVLLTPVGDHWPAAAPPPALALLDSWR